MGVALLVENDLGLIVEIVTFDLTEGESHSSVVQPTSFPVEVGVNISDHLRAQPKAFSCSVYVTNHPIKINFLKQRGRYELIRLDLPRPFRPESLFRGAAIASPGAGVRTALAALERRLNPPVISAFVLTFDPFDAIAEVENKLTSLQDIGAKLRVVSTLKEYTDMYLTVVNHNRTFEDGSGARFDLEFAQIRKVSPLNVKAPEIPLEPRGGPTKFRGGVGAKTIEASRAPEKATRSMLEGMIQNLF